MKSDHSENDNEDSHSPHAHEDAAHGHDEPWLVSYADMMTLLFGFFVILYSLNAHKKDSPAWQKARKNLAAHFGGEYVVLFETTQNELEQVLKKKDIWKNMEIIVTPEGMTVTFKNKALFESGSADLLPEAKEAIELLVELVRKKGDDFLISIEGHTDDIPIMTFRYPSNWELSAARSATVMKMFEGHGFLRKNFTVLAYADTRPQEPNRRDDNSPYSENMALNRRVVIRIFEFLE